MPVGRREADSDWLPELCQPMALFGIVVLVELAVLLMLLSPARPGLPRLAELGAASLFAQWLALTSATALCLIRPMLLRLGPRRGWPVAALLPIVLTALLSLVVHWIDVELGLQLSLPASERARFVLANTAICALLTLALLRYFHLAQQSRLALRAQAEARFDALQARIRPHFLFNAMNTILSLIPTRPAQAEAGIEDLCDLLRASLSDQPGETTLADELALIERYLNLERLRLGERLRVEQDIDPAVLNTPLPPLLLQPLVENAVLHGIQQLEAGGLLRLFAHRDGGELCLGVGNPCPRPGRRSEGLGLALENIRRRLAHRWGSAARLELERAADYHLATLRIPLR